MRPFTKSGRFVADMHDITPLETAILHGLYFGHSSMTEQAH